MTCSQRSFLVRSRQMKWSRTRGFYPSYSLSMQGVTFSPRSSILVKSWVALSYLNGTSGSCSRGRMVFNSARPKCPLLLPLLLDRQPAGMALYVFILKS